MNSKNIEQVNVLLVSDMHINIDSYNAALKHSNYQLCKHITTAKPLLNKIEQFEPEIILYDLVLLNPPLLQTLNLFSGINPKPIVMFCQHDGHIRVDELLSVGVTSYIHGSADFGRLVSILDVARARFTEREQLKLEVQTAKQQLKEHKILAQAKVLLMDKYGLNEQEAYHKIRKQAMNESKSIIVIAKAIIANDCTKIF